MGESDSNRGIPTPFPEGIKDSKKYISLGQPGIRMKITFTDPPRNPVILYTEVHTYRKYDFFDISDETSKVNIDDCLVELQKGPVCSVHGDSSVESRESDQQPAEEEETLEVDGEFVSTDHCQVEQQKGRVRFVPKVSRVKSWESDMQHTEEEDKLEVHKKSARTNDFSVELQGLLIFSDHEDSRDPYLQPVLIQVNVFVILVI